MSYLIKCKNTYEGTYLPKYRTFPFELDHFQKYACEGIDNNHNVFISVPTGAGKTVPAEYAISKAYAEGNKIVYISPIKTLSNQKYSDFSKEYSNIGIMTGDNKINPDAQLLIMTAEIFRNSLYRTKWNQSKENMYQFDPKLVKYIVLDEIHYINDMDRGKVWEEILMLLPKDIHITMLSATINSPEVLAEWVGNYQKKPTRLITLNKRPIPLKYYLQQYNKKELIMDTKFIENSFTLIPKDQDIPKNKKINYKIQNYKPIFWINHCIEQLKTEDKLPSIFFVLSKNLISSYSKDIIGDFLCKDEIAKVKAIWKEKLFKYKQNYAFSEQYQEIYNLSIRGIAFHHSGTIPILKEIIEILYSQKLIKVLLATETFAVGVNMPTKTVIFTGLTKYDNNGKRLLRTDEFLQMAGRAGRRGIDTFGEVIILPINIPSESEFKRIVLGKNIVLNSKLMLDYSWVLKNIFLFNNICDDITEEKLIKFLVENANNSFLEKNTPQEKIKLVNSLEELQKQNDFYESKLDSEYINEYFTLQDNLNKKLSKKNRKNILSKLNNIKNNNNFNTLEKYIKNKDNIYKLSQQIKFNDDKLYIHFKYMIDYLTKELFIENNILTDFGLIVKEINEINPIIISYMAFEKYLDNISFPELVGFLSIFLETKSKKISFGDLELNSDQKHLLENTNEIANYYLDQEIELCKSLPYQFIQNYDLSLDNYKACYDWADGKSWNEIKHYYGGFEGQFCKVILRLHNMLREIMVLFEILKKDNLVKMINEKQDSLIKEIVQLDSLYLV